jgi:hypothetical protein
MTVASQYAGTTTETNGSSSSRTGAGRRSLRRKKISDMTIHETAVTIG